VYVDMLQATEKEKANLVKKTKEIETWEAEVKNKEAAYKEKVKALEAKEKELDDREKVLAKDEEKYENIKKLLG
jgi:thiamine monophosphate synthase